MRRIISLKRVIFVSALVFLIGSIGIYQRYSNSLTAKVFFDLPVGNPVQEPASFLAEQKIISGYSDGTFRPGNYVNRAELTKIVVILAKKRGPIKTCKSLNDLKFYDVNPNEWYAPYVCAAKVNGLVKGYPDGTFKPGNTVSFVEAVAMLVRVLGFEVEQKNPWYRPYVEELAKRNAIPTNIQSFNSSLTRGDLAEVLYRLLTQETTKPSLTYKELSGEKMRPAAPSSLSAEFLPLINSVRAKYGLQALRENPVLTIAAQLHSNEMNSLKRLSHYSADGSSAQQRMLRAGYPGCNCAYSFAENVTEAKNAQHAMDMWMASQGHKVNVLSPSYNEIGIGKSGIYWTNTFGRIKYQY